MLTKKGIGKDSKEETWNVNGRNLFRKKTSHNYLISNFKIDSWCMLCGNFLRGKNLESRNA